MSVRDYIEHLKSKPESVRRRIAVGTSLTVALMVAVGWFGALTVSGDLTLGGSQTQQATVDLVQVTQDSTKGLSELMGAVNAFQQTTGKGAAPISVVETRASSTLESAQPSVQTVIPF